MDYPASSGCNRRGFLKAAAFSTAALAIEPGLCQTGGMSSSVLPRREFGKTGIRLSIIGMGGIVSLAARCEGKTEIESSRPK